MRRIHFSALLLTAAIGSLTGCMRIVTMPEPRPVVAERPAVLDKLALVVPVVDGVAPYVAVSWHRARLTIGRYDGTMAEVTHTFESTRAGLRSVGAFPALPPGDGYWLRVDLVQDSADGLERVVGRGWAGDEDEAGIDLVSGGNLARLDIRPTVLGTQIALSPVRPPAPRDEDWSPRWEVGVREVSVAPDTWSSDDAPAPSYETESFDEPADDDDEPDDDYGEAAYDDDATDDSDDSAWSDSASDSDSDADVPTGDVIDSYSAYRGNP